MNLLEFEGKKLLSRYGIEVPESVLIKNGDRISTVPFGLPVFLKAQVPIGGRGKAGGVVKIGSISALGPEFHRIKRLTIGGYPVSSVLMEQMVHGRREIYIAISIDGATGAPALLIGREGGIDIESTSPESRMKMSLDIMEDIPGEVVKAAVDFLAIPVDIRPSFSSMVHQMYIMFRDKDLELVEINPLIMTDEGRLVAVDAKIVLNDDSTFRNPDIAMSDLITTSTWETRCRAGGFVGVKLDGIIGVIANGAGLTMASLDAVSDLGMTGGAFLDLGGSDDPERIARAIVLMLDGVGELGLKGILINVFGGITRCDTVAEGILRVPRKGAHVPIVVRMRGVNEETGRSMLAAQKIPAYLDMDEACRKLKEVV